VTIAQAELALEVDRPDHVGASDGSLRSAGMGADLGASASADTAVPDQDAVDGRGGGDPGRGMSLEEQLVELAGAPAPSCTQLEDLADHRGRRRVGALLRPMGAIGQTVGPETAAIPKLMTTW
jgi:hypothetical protein